MADSSTIIRERQLAVRREIDRRGISLKATALDSDIPYATLLSYLPAPGSRDPAVMPVSALFSLIGILPDDLLSLLLPDTRRIITVPEELDHDELCEAMQDYLHHKAKAHHPDSPGGREITEDEDAELDAKAARLVAVKP
ncbi:hypothetical protein SZ64_04535 [Erythrobacter sp. SG61-1L]|uniref:hypothetical protein n=1 Tax=Erythrobacter sp. SG61-1L TaxID=1603897 RepID=UPI0006C8FB5F|nr:hypothetical protein [Erythrobacter sp. SG61-1L]KPL67434.1 hypothetical protein SZ64_04535 [Erythrobacter sp. SG61-1L]